MAYRGSVIRLPVGTLGLSGSRNPTQLLPGHFEFVEGVTLDGSLIQKEGGAAKLNSAALGSGSVVTAGIHYVPGVAQEREVVFLSNGSILKDTGPGTFAVTLASGLNSTRDPPPRFVVGGREAVGSPSSLFLFSSVNQVQVVDGDGATMAAIATPPTDWTGAGNFPTFGIMHDGRLWGGGNASDPHRIYYSSLTDHQVFTGAGTGTLAIWPGIGNRLVGAASFKGFLVLFKYPVGVMYVDTTNPDPAAWRVDVLSSAVGGVNQHCVVPVDNDILYMDAGGHMNLLSATDEHGGVKTSDVGTNIDLPEFVRSEINTDALIRAVGVWCPASMKAVFGLPRLGVTDNTMTLSMDFNHPEIGLRFLTSRRDTPISLWLRPDAFDVHKPVHGDTAGFVWLMDQAARNKAGVAYEMKFETANMDLSHADPKLASVNKAGDFLELIFEPQGDWDLIVRVVWDDVSGPAILYSMGGNGAALGAFTLDSDILSSTSIRSIRKRIGGQGRRLRIIASNFGLDDNVAISDFLLSFRPTNERTNA